VEKNAFHQYSCLSPSLKCLLYKYISKKKIIYDAHTIHDLRGSVQGVDEGRALTSELLVQEGHHPAQGHHTQYYSDVLSNEWMRGEHLLLNFLSRRAITLQVHRDPLSITQMFCPRSG
jgi:hypothetical protein